MLQHGDGSLTVPRTRSYEIAGPRATIAALCAPAGGTPNNARQLDSEEKGKLLKTKERVLE